MVLTKTKYVEVDCLNKGGVTWTPNFNTKTNKGEHMNIQVLKTLIQNKETSFLLLEC